MTEVTMSVAGYSSEAAKLQPILEKLEPLKTLHLTFIVFFESDTPYLAAALKKLKNLEDFLVGGVQKGGLEPIIKNLSNLPNLVRLRFENSALSSGEAQELSEKILSLQNLITLEFKEMRIEAPLVVDQLFMELGTSSIRSLIFSCSEQGNRVVAVLMQQPQFLQNLQYLDLSGTKLSLASVHLLTEHFIDMPNLISLNLGGCFSMESIEEIKEEEAIEEEEDNDFDFGMDEFLCESEKAERKQRHSEAREKEKAAFEREKAARLEAREIRQKITEKQGDLPSLKNLYL